MLKYLIFKINFMKKTILISGLSIAIIIVLFVLVIRLHPYFNETKTYEVCADESSISGNCSTTFIYKNINNKYFCYIKGGLSRQGLTSEFDCVKK